MNYYDEYTWLYFKKILITSKRFEKSILYCYDWLFCECYFPVMSQVNF